jgi:sigma-B regulation protein RsbU (phosphoserine phosphatase)
MPVSQSADKISHKNHLLLIWPLLLFAAVSVWLLIAAPQISLVLVCLLAAFALVAAWAIYAAYKSSNLESAKRRLHQEAALAADRSNAVLDAAADGVISADANKAVSSFNPGAERLFGFKAAEIQGKPLDTLFAEAWRVPANSFFEMLLRKSGNSRMKIGETLALHKSGREFPLYVTLSSSKSKDEPVLFMVARDISARKQVEQKLRKSAESQNVLNQLLRLSLEEGALNDLLMRALNSIFSFPWLSSQAKGGIFLSGRTGDYQLIPVAHQGMSSEEIEHIVHVGAAEAGFSDQDEPPKEGEPMTCALVDEAYAIKFCSRQSRGYYNLPIVSSGRLLGVAVLYVVEGKHNPEDESTFLEAVSHTLASLIEKRQAADALVESEANLRAKQERLDEDLRAAADIQHTLLPQKMPDLKEVALAWKFVPNQHIGGDIFNAYMLDERRLVLYMVDVSGHGVPSGLVTVSVHEMLTPQGGHVAQVDESGGLIPAQPKQVLDLMSREYPVERFNKTFSIVYALMDIKTGMLTYASAGHPHPVVLQKEGGLAPLGATGPIIGLGALLPFEQAEVQMKPGDKLILYTDGVVEYENRFGEFYGDERFYALLLKNHQEDLNQILEGTWQAMMEYGAGIAPRDDVSMMGLEYLGD